MAANPQSPNSFQDFRYLTMANIETGITATASGGQSTAYQLNAQHSVIATVATAGDSVALPKIYPFAAGDARPGGVGMVITVKNNGAHPCQVYGVTPDTINAIATGTGVLLAAGAMLVATASGYTQSTNVGLWDGIIVQNGGEVQTTTVAVGSAVSETTATPVDVCTLSLEPGTWEVEAVVQRVLTGTTATIYGAGISLTANTMPPQAGGSGLGTDAFCSQSATFGTTVTGNYTTTVPPVPLVITSTTTVHLVAADTFSAGSIGLYGTIRAYRFK